jgi:hypothetical protein
MLSGRRATAETPDPAPLAGPTEHGPCFHWQAGPGEKVHRAGLCTDFTGRIGRAVVRMGGGERARAGQFAPARAGENLREQRENLREQGASRVLWPARALRARGQSTRAGASRACSSRVRGEAPAGYCARGCASRREEDIARAGCEQGDFSPAFPQAIERSRRGFGSRERI